MSYENDVPNNVPTLLVNKMCNNYNRWVIKQLYLSYKSQHVNELQTIQ